MAAPITFEQSLVALIERATAHVLGESAKGAPRDAQVSAELEIPRERAHGDVATNVAMRTCRLAGTSPMVLAERIKAQLLTELDASPVKGIVERIEVKAPGFINFFLSHTYLLSVLQDVLNKNDDFGRVDIGHGEKFQIEFVSANPTGPLTIAHGRQAAIGDSLANILQFAGYDVTREYYLNDEGVQMNILGESIRLRYRELCGITEPFIDNGYKGAYVYDIAKDFKEANGEKYKDATDITPFREYGLVRILDGIKKDLAEFGVKFDVWYSQRELAKSGKVEKALALLKERGYIFEQEGAVWFKSTAFGDDKDRVVIKSDGTLTYLTPDIAYHLEKYRRGFKRIVDIWGPDHHGYIPRMKAAIQALGFDKESLSVLIVQLATLYRSGEVVSMSTRAGEFITLREVMDEVGKDVSRFCFTMRRISSHLDFDLDVVKKESSENPVYYIQYAHARIWSIFDKSKDVGVAAEFDGALLKESEEIELVRVLRQFPMVVALSARLLEPYVLLQYLQDLATLFHSFYNKHRVVGDDPRLVKARLVLVDGVRIVLANGLRLLGVSMPKKM